MVGGGVDAGGGTLDQEDDGAVEPGRVAGDCHCYDDGAHGPQSREQ